MGRLGWRPGRLAAGGGGAGRAPPPAPPPRPPYSATRQLRASFRRAELLAVVADYGGLLARGVQVRLARHFGVSEATISRDLRGILAPYGPARCPCCGAP
jgi:hypothetical protein